MRLAGIGADGVAVAGQFGPALSGLVGCHRPVVDLTEDRPLEHGRVDDGGFGMRVAGRVVARCRASIFHWRKDGSPLPFSSSTTNLAGSVLLALRPTTCASVGPS